MILLNFAAANICVYFQYLLCIWVCANIFGAIVLRFKINIVVMIIWSIVIIINFVLTLQVLTTSLSHDREPCEIKVVFNHTCSLHTCVCAGSRRRRLRLSGFRRQGIASLLGVSQVALFRSGSVPNTHRGFMVVLHCQMQNFFIEPPPDTQRKERQGKRGLWVAMSCYLSHASPPLPLPPPPHRASVAPSAATLSG